MNQKELTDKIKKGHEVLDKIEETSLSDPPKGSYQEQLNNRLKERKEKNSKW